MQKWLYYSPSDKTVGNSPNAFDPALDKIAPPDRANAGWSACKYKVTRLQSHICRKLGNDTRDRPDQRVRGPAT